MENTLAQSQADYIKDEVGKMSQDQRDLFYTTLLNLTALSAFGKNDYESFDNLNRSLANARTWK